MSVADPKNDLSRNVSQQDTVKHPVFPVRVHDIAHPCHAHHMQLRVQRAVAEERQYRTISRPHDKDQRHRQNPPDIEINRHHP
jgi:hypothetical protein